MDHPTRVAQACSFLFAPGNQPEISKKAIGSDADAVILDLEDSVPASDKALARSSIERAWSDLYARGVPLLIRINALNSDAGETDLEWIKPLLPSPAAVMLPKAESGTAVERVHDQVNGVSVLPIIENAIGYAALSDVSAARGVLRLVLGHIDFMADTGLQCDEMETELTPLRFAIAMATRVNRLAPAVDGVTVQLHDEQRVRTDAQRALRFGFGGKLCIHPRQVRVVNEAFAPNEQELEWARRVIAADATAGGAAIQLDGRMIDLPVVIQARSTLARARERQP